MKYPTATNLLPSSGKESTSLFQEPDLMYNSPEKTHLPQAAALQIDSFFPLFWCHEGQAKEKSELKWKAIWKVLKMM